MKTRQEERNNLKAHAYQLLRNFASTFAEVDENGDYWGHDTNLGDCEQEFETAYREILKLATQYRIDGIERIATNVNLSRHGKRTTITILKNEAGL